MVMGYDKMCCQVDFPQFVHREYRTESIRPWEPAVWMDQIDQTRRHDLAQAYAVCNQMKEYKVMAANCVLTVAQVRGNNALNTLNAQIAHAVVA